MEFSSKTGEITLYFKKQWKVNTIKENIKNSKHSISAYKARYECISFIIFIIYRSPNYNKAKFCEDFQQFKKKNYKSKLETMLNVNELISQIMK